MNEAQHEYNTRINWRIMTSLDCTKFASRDTWMTDGPTGLMA